MEKDAKERERLKGLKKQKTTLMSRRSSVSRIGLKGGLLGQKQKQTLSSMYGKSETYSANIKVHDSKSSSIMSQSNTSMIFSTSNKPKINKSKKKEKEFSKFSNKEMNSLIENIKIKVEKGEGHEQIIPSVCKIKHLEQGAKALLHYKH